MKREDIEKAALDFSGGRYDSEESNYQMAKAQACCLGFINGAEWRIKSVWHDAKKEQPNLWKLLLRKDKRGDYELGLEIKHNTVSWAYIEDLIPNTEE